MPEHDLDEMERKWDEAATDPHCEVDHEGLLEVLYEARSLRRVLEAAERVRHAYNHQMGFDSVHLNKALDDEIARHRQDFPHE